MGRKKHKAEDAAQEEDRGAKSKTREREKDSDDEPDEPPRHYDIDPDIQELAYSFNIDPGLTQRLNDLMIEERQRTWEQDLARLYEILKDAHTPAAMLNLKLRDMEKGTFVGKAKCQAKVREICSKHRLDKGASTKLEEAMSMREAMGKDVEKDLFLLDEHLAASNAPSKLVSMKLDSLRKGFNIGHCIYSREPMPGNQGPGVDGVFDKRTGKRVLGYTDADLDKRFAEQDFGGSSGQLMDEATVRRMMAAERQQHQAKIEEEQAAEEPSRSCSRAKRKKKAKDKGKEKEREKAKEKDRGRSESGGRRRSRSRSRSRSSTPKGKQGRGRAGGGKKAGASRGRSSSQKRKSRGRSGSQKRKSRARSASGRRRKSRSRKKSRSTSGRRRRSPSGRRRKRSKERSCSASPKKKEGKEKKSGGKKK